jgi:hypothetical protein
MRLDKDVPTRIDVPLPGPVWEGNLWGTTIGALPLSDGKTLTLPFYQYDKGVGRFVATVTGSERVSTPAGAVDAWTVELGVGDTSRSTYLIGKDGVELGYRAGPFSEALGGDCSGLD